MLVNKNGHCPKNNLSCELCENLSKSCCHTLLDILDTGKYRFIKTFPVFPFHWYTSYGCTNLLKMGNSHGKPFDEDDNAVIGVLLT